MVQVIERVGGRYDVREVEFGRVYRWLPERVVVECVCGERPSLTRSETTCGGCGADHAALVRESGAGRRSQRGEALHPWRSWHSSEDTGLPL